MNSTHTGAPQIHDLVAWAAQACTAAGELVAGALGEVTEIQDKAPFDQVSELDVRVEEFLAETLGKAVPGSAVVGEEREKVPGQNVTWYVDPIDGTNNFLRGLPFACVSVGAAVDGTLVAGCVYDPFRRECFTGGVGSPLRVNGRPARSTVGRFPLVLTDLPRPGGLDEDHAEQAAFLTDLVGRSDVRRIGASALALAWVAAGRADAACNLRVKPWDVAGGAALVCSVDGFFDPVGTPDPVYDTPKVACGGFVAGARRTALTHWIGSRLTEIVR